LDTTARELAHMAIAFTEFTNLVMMMMLALGQHPEVVKEARGEIERVIKDVHSAPSMDELDQLHYCDSIIRETLRFYSFFPSIHRWQNQQRI